MEADVRRATCPKVVSGRRTPGGERYSYDAYGYSVITSVNRHDVNYDGVWNSSDSSIIASHTGQSPCVAGPIYDINGNGTITFQDTILRWPPPPALVTLSESSLGNPYLFTGRRLDVLSADGYPLTALYHYRAREYDPTHGRFMQRDMLQYVDGMNLYEYVRSKPLNGTDPTGLWFINRNGGRTALATSTTWQIDTMNSLASRIGLEIASNGFISWLGIPGNGTLRTNHGTRTINTIRASDVICPGQQVIIPNTVTAFWAGSFGDFGKGLMGWNENVRTLRTRGFFVDERDFGLVYVGSGGKQKTGNIFEVIGSKWSFPSSTTKAQIQKIVRDYMLNNELHGIYYLGHGFDIINFAGIGVYKPALGVLVGCGTASQRSDYSKNAIFWGWSGTWIPVIHPSPRIADLLPPGAQGTRR